MRVFDIDLTPAILEEIALHAERDYPTEACGLVLGRPGATELACVAPMRNVQDRYHAQDPERFPRTGRDAFRIDELEHLRALERAEREGLIERVLYHSHCDAGAYFSPEDRAMAVTEGIELLPGVVHLVVSVRRKKRSGMAAFRWSSANSTFEEVRVELGDGELLLPDLAGRAMEGRDSTRPIRPVGGALVPRRVTLAERERLEPAAEKAHIRVDSAETMKDIERFGLGLYSPLPGFLRAVEIRAIEQSGRLLSGTPWRTPITLDIPSRKSAIFPPLGAVVELVDPDGRPFAAMGLQEVVRVDKETARLAGPVFVYENAQEKRPRRDAAEMRAEILRRGLRRVLAVGPAFVERASGTDLSEFDGVLAALPISCSASVLELPLTGRGTWVDAVMAQNLGATHFWVEDPLAHRAIEETLEIAPWTARPRLAFG